LQVFDRWAQLGDDPGAQLSGHVVEALGTEVARMVFDYGFPGSAQVLAAWDLDATLFMVDDEGAAYGIRESLKRVLREWAEFTNAEIHCPGLRPTRIDVRGLRPGHRLWINGSWWMVSEEGKLRRSHGNLKPMMTSGSKSGSAPDHAPLASRTAAVPTAPTERASASEHEARADRSAAVRDFQAALNEWRFAAAKGSPTAHWKLALMYCRGRGVARDVFEAARRCRSAAEWGHPRAALRIAHAHQRLFNHRIADQWLRRVWKDVPARPDWARDRFVAVEATTSQAEKLLRDAAALGRRDSQIAWVSFLVAHGRADEARAYWDFASVPDVLCVADALLLELSGAREALGLGRVGGDRDALKRKVRVRTAASVIPFRAKTATSLVDEHDFPDYLGLGTLDAASATRTSRDFRARYVSPDADPVYEVVHTAGAFTVREIWRGTPVGEWTASTLTQAFFASLPRETGCNPRFDETRRRVQAAGVSMQGPGSVAYFPAGFVYQLMFPIVEETRPAGVQFKAQLTDSSIALEREYSATLLIAIVSGEIMAEPVLGVSFLVTLRDLWEFVQTLSGAGLVAAPRHHRPAAFCAPAKRHIHVFREPREHVVAFTLLPLDPPHVSLQAAVSELRSALPDLQAGIDPLLSPDEGTGRRDYAPGATVFIPGGATSVVTKELPSLLEFCRSAWLDQRGDPAGAQLLLTRLLETERLKSVNEPAFATVLETAAPRRSEERRHPWAPWNSIVRVRLASGEAPGLEVWTLSSFFSRPILIVDE
jgi:hypothetical protein